MALPMMPGNSVNRNLGREKFHKSQHFDYSNGVAMMVGTEKPGIGGELLLGQSTRPKYSLFPKREGGDTPAWVAFNKQVLCFDAYFQETVPQRREEKYRVRKCKIYFYLEDDTIQVVEPELKNSGIPQGTLIRRHRIPLPAPKDDCFYNVHHFNINQEILLYSRTFMITDCDPFTRNFLMKMGVRINPPASAPADPYSTLRQEMEENMKPRRPYERLDTMKQFLEHDRKVLRFCCYWDDTESMFGNLREMVLHYFLADDTMEIYEVVPPNSGRDAVPKFLHRGKLPKNAPIPKRQPGEITDRTVLNVFGPVGQGGRYILDSLKTGALDEEVYKDCDLIIGGVINVWGRRVLLCDCDNFTKEYYRSKYGIEDFTPVSFKAPPPPKPAKQVPPYTGFGSEEDSLCSCQSLLPKPPQKDFRKLLEKDRQGLVSNVLRFVGKMLTDRPIDKERVFIICLYLSDDTIAVFEPPQRNSGLIGGKFLERGRVKKPGQELFKSEKSEYYTAQDLYVGARVDLNNQPFQLLDADEFTFNYMEQHADEFPKANIGTIISKVKSTSEEQQKKVKQFIMMSDPSSTGFIPYESFRTLLADMDIQLSEHEIMTLGRNYSVQKQPEVNVGLMLAMAQDQLKKKSFENFSDMIRAFTHEDRGRSGYLSSKEARIICKAFRLPLSDDLLRALLEKFQDESEKIDYHAFLSGINWRENPAPAVLPDVTVKFDADWRQESADPAVKTINYSLLLEDVFGSATNINDS
ncbi:EF-hand domain-containing family member C2 isoform X1 [Pimephales promelas]|uniref:EF-hand domain-containing family member C2 isoform X1 n=1 Tax=Pimephales promelas TaxID=90988 RepID=UPI001955D1DE|nr:EF-hand domain-containing family member C2 isoform X1 [Pimephales promelas]KAG1970362.1 EF-hand domain-containing family member C2 [Pimephales promelas]